MTLFKVLAACCTCKHKHTGAAVQKRVGVVHAPKYGTCSKDLYHTIVLGGPPGVLTTQHSQHLAATHASHPEATILDDALQPDKHTLITEKSDLKLTSEQVNIMLRIHDSKGLHTIRPIDL